MDDGLRAGKSSGASRNDSVTESRGQHHKHYPGIIIIMAARQLAGRRPLYFTADVSILLLPFFRHLISKVSGPIVTKLCHMFVGDCNFLMSVKNLGVPPQKIWGPKNIKISDLMI